MGQFIPLPNGTTVWVSTSIDPMQQVVPAPTDSSWVQVQRVTDTGFSPSGGEESWATFMPLGSDVETVRPAGRSPHQVSLQFQDAPDSVYAQLITSARDAKRVLAWMLVLPTGARITFPGYATSGYLPVLSKNELMVIEFTIGLTAMPKRLAA